MSQMDVCDSGGIDFEARVSAQRPNAGALLRFVRLLDRLIAAYAEHLERRQTMALLRKMSDSQLCDIGFDPTAVFGERIGTIGEVHGDRFHGL